MPRRQKQPRESLVRVPLPWTTLTGKPVTESDLLEMIGQLSVKRTLPALISLLQYGDLTDPPAYEVLDRQVRDLFPTETARRIADELARRSDWMFFSKWQLLLAIKLVCAFGSRDAGTAGTSDTQFLNLLLMINGFYPGGEDAPNTPEGDLEAVQETALLGYALMQNERPYNLIGRYAELFDHLPTPGNRAEFNAWVDIRSVLAEELGLRMGVFKAVLFALRARSGIGASWLGDGRPGLKLGSLNPEIYFANTLVPEAELTRALDLVTITADEIRDQHLAQYGEHLGNPVDLRGCLKRVQLVWTHEGREGGVGRSVGVWNDQLIPATSATENGNCGNPCYLRPSRAGGRSPTRDGRSSTPSATCCAPAAPGGCCPMTCRRGALCSITSAPGVGTELGSGPTTRCTPCCGRLRAGRPAPARPSSTASR